jgi:hypothetical protein
MRGIVPGFETVGISRTLEVYDRLPKGYRIAKPPMPSAAALLGNMSLDSN